LQIVQAAAAEGIATANALRYGGLTRKEHGAQVRSQQMKARFAALPDEVQERKRQEARERLSRAREALSVDG